jgi:hypothetical protein
VTAEIAREKKAFGAPRFACFLCSISTTSNLLR